MDFQPLREYMTGLIEKGVPGLEVAVCRNHRVLFHECMGYSDYERQRKASSSDRYWMYSCTKPVLAAAAMQCVERGWIGLDDPVAKFLPAYADAYVMENGEKRIVGGGMTIRHLFTMTAGLDYRLNRPQIRALCEQTAGRAGTKDIVQSLAEDALSFRPGARFQYSLCHDVLGAVIEVVSGMSLRDYMKKNIFEPLRMTRTDFWTAGEKPDDLAAQYRYDAGSRRLLTFDAPNEFVLSENYYSGGCV